MKFSLGDLVKIKKTMSYDEGTYLTRLIQDNVNDFLVESYFVTSGVHALVVRLPTDPDNEFYGEYEILIGKELYYSPEDFLELATEEQNAKTKRNNTRKTSKSSTR